MSAQYLEYASEPVEFLGLIDEVNLGSGVHPTVEQIQSYAQLHFWSFPALYDLDSVIAENLGYDLAGEDGNGWPVVGIIDASTMEIYYVAQGGDSPDDVIDMLEQLLAE
jgi:hypothetical protein